LNDFLLQTEDVLVEPEIAEPTPSTKKKREQEMVEDKKGFYQVSHCYSQSFSVEVG
jgi:hypothetical protein